MNWYTGNTTYDTVLTIASGRVLMADSAPRRAG
jgi:hypothetical protein